MLVLIYAESCVGPVLPGFRLMSRICHDDIVHIQPKSKKDSIHVKNAASGCVAGASVIKYEIGKAHLSSLSLEASYNFRLHQIKQNRKRSCDRVQI